MNKSRKARRMANKVAKQKAMQLKILANEYGFTYHDVFAQNKEQRGVDKLKDYLVSKFIT